MPEASGEKELVIGRIFQTIEGDEKHGALQLRGMRHGVHPTMKCPSLFATDLNIWHVESVSSSSMSFNMSNGILLSPPHGT